MFKVGDKVNDKEYGIIVTIEDREYKLEIPINNEMEGNKNENK